MRTISASLQTHLDGSATSLGICWRVVRRDGVILRGTEHDNDITIDAFSPDPLNLAGTYLSDVSITGSNVKSGSELGVDNMEVEGAVKPTLATFNDLSAADIEAGVYDGASVVLFFVNWRDTTQGTIVLRSGTLGNIQRDSDGKYVAELRGLTQALSQTIVRTYGVQCDTDLGSTVCGVNLATYTVTGTVSAVTSRRAFSATFGTSPLPSVEANFFVGGLLTFTSGANNGYGKEVKTHTVGSPNTVNSLTIYEPFAADIEVGDTFTLKPGCDKSAATCKARFNNIVNFQGYGLFTPGQKEVLRGPGGGLGG